MECLLNRLRGMALPAVNETTVTLGQKPIDEVTAADLHVLRRDWTLNTKGARGGTTGPTRALKRLRHFYNWAIEQGHTTTSPFKRGHVNTVHFAKEPGRTRRLEGDEEKRLLKHAVSPLMRALITAALETGCRVGELLALTWADVKWDDNLLLLPAAITKTREARGVPISQNLKAVLDLRRHAPDGTDHAASARVFGNECAESVRYWRVREDWRLTCEAAGVHGVNFHDLRRTSASMLRMSGAPDHVVAAWLGHSNISTTSRYLRASNADLQKQLKAFEAHRATKPNTAQRKRRKDSHTVRTRRRSAPPLTTPTNPSKSVN
jgi:integrase